MCSVTLPGHTDEISNVLNKGQATRVGDDDNVTVMPTIAAGLGSAKLSCFRHPTDQFKR